MNGPVEEHVLCIKKVYCSDPENLQLYILKSKIWRAKDDNTKQGGSLA